MAFVHLHVHTHYSIRDGLSSIDALFKRANELGMPGLAITDHGNIYGVKEFANVAKRYPDIKPILGCEIYVTRHYDHRLKDPDHRKYYHLVLLAKNFEGYTNLMKLVSVAHIEGQYYRPRVSHEILEKYSGNLICCSACVAGEVATRIWEDNIEEAEKAIEWHKRVFGDDYYLEVQLHKTEVPGLSLDLYERQKQVNAAIFELAKKTNTKVVCSNDVHFVMKEDGPTHDRLLCLNSGSATLNSPDRIRYTQQEYLKSEEEMRALFPDHPEILDNTLEVLDKIERYEIDRNHVLPKFTIDEKFLSEKDKYLELYKDVIDAGRYEKDGTDRGEEFCWSVAYLCHLCYKGAEERYGKQLTEEQAERLDFELKTISRMGFPDYFLIVQDFIAAARAEGTFVGPGRGSAAGSAVAYCLKITNLDPIKYDLLFERFLNPDRISMPDIDIDFDDEGRYNSFKYVENTYGKDHISHVITFGTMAAKSAIKDVARISELSLDETARLTKMIPDRLSFEAEVEVEETQENGTKKKVKRTQEFKTNLKNCVEHIPELKKEYESGSDLVREVLNYAIKLEGCIRQVGVHACAMIIGRGNLTDYIPITLATDKSTKEEVWTSQYDGHYIEEVGMLKMDFLGLKTLSIIKECLELIRLRHGVSVDIEKIPLDDKAVFDLFGRGDSKCIFQFESDGMRNWLQKLQPSRFEDLIAMNALYRPGPMQYIPNFVARKHGKEPVLYDLPEMESILSDTYGITVYQEQVMLLARRLAGFTRGESDKLRKAMGKKQDKIIDELREKFITGGVANGYPQEALNKIYNDWEKFAKYAFNKSHSTCYAWIGYQTAYLKAHYPAEFLAANLSKNLDKITEIQSIIDDCKKMGIKVLNPDINESNAHFTVNKNGDIRFGLGGIKGFGSNVVSAIVDEREANGLFKDIYDFAERMAGVINRKAYDALIFSGALDGFGYSRMQYVLPCPNGEIFVDELIKYADLYKRDKENSAISLFGDTEEFKPVRPEFPQNPNTEINMELLHKEKELVGMYLAAHPLDRYAFEIETFTNCPLAELDALIARCTEKKNEVVVEIAGFVTAVEQSLTKTGRPSYKATIEDFSGKYEIKLFGKLVDTFKPHLQQNTAVHISARIEKPYNSDTTANPAASYMLRLKEVSMLGNITEKRVKNFCLNINTEQLNSEFRTQLLKITKKHKGDTPFLINLYDPTTKYKIELLSTKVHVAVNGDFINDVKGLGVDYKINS